MSNEVETLETAISLSISFSAEADEPGQRAVVVSARDTAFPEAMSSLRSTFVLRTIGVTEAEEDLEIPDGTIEYLEGSTCSAAQDLSVRGLFQALVSMNVRLLIFRRVHLDPSTLEDLGLEVSALDPEGPMAGLVPDSHSCFRAAIIPHVLSQQTPSQNQGEEGGAGPNL